MNFRNKKILSLFLSLVLVLGIVIGAAPMLASADAESRTLTIVHTNDVHGHVEGDEEVIGFEKLKTMVDGLKAEGKNVLLLNAGDTLHGTNLANISKGETIVDLMNDIGFDALTPGNHEFNYGYERLLELSKMANFPFLGANIVKEKDGTSDFKPYVIKEYDGLKVGIFGITTDETKVKSHPKNTLGIEFSDVVEVSKQMVDELKGKVDLIVALAHLGIDQESVNTSILVAENVEGIDIIVDGHSHSKLPEGKLVGDTLIVQANHWTKDIGIVEVEIKEGKVVNKTAKLVEYDEAKDIVPDPKVAKAIKDIESKNEEILSEVLGTSKSELVGKREVVRAGESNLGNLLTDAMLHASDADVALTNGGGIRADMPQGEITLGDALTAFPFDNYLVVIEVSGQDIIDALNYGVAAYPEPAGKFPHVAGMSYKIDTSGEANRVLDVMVGDKAIDPKATYKLVTNDFVGAGGDGYTMFEGSKVLDQSSVLSEILSEYIKELGVVDAKVEGRITKYEKPVAEEKYTVKSGDVLWKIGRVFNKTYTQLADYNKLKNPHLIYPGQIILIPH